MSHSFVRWIVPALALAGFAVLLHSSPAVAQDAAAAPATQPTGTLTVTVTDQDGNPAASATVNVRHATVRRSTTQPTNPNAAPAAPVSRTPVATGTTDDKGVISFPNIPPGDYNVAVRSSDRATRARGTATIKEGETATLTVKLGAGRAAGGGGGGGGGGGAAGGGGGN